MKLPKPYKHFKRKKNKYTFDFDLKLYPSNLKIELTNQTQFNRVFYDVMFFRDKDFYTEFVKFGFSINHMLRFIWRYDGYLWYKETIDIQDLMNVYMCPVGWLRRFACVNEKCPEFKNDDCINCKNKNMQIFTLKDVIQGYSVNKTKFTEKIEQLKTRIALDIKTDVEMQYLFCTLVKNKHGKYFVLDGNSRLLAFGLYATENQNQKNNKIKTYIGER